MTCTCNRTARMRRHTRDCALVAAEEHRIAIHRAAIEVMGDHETSHAVLARHARANGRVLVRAEVK